MRLGAYEVLSELGRGGMGVVYRARGAAGADVAIKVLHKQDSPDAVARFARERRLLLALGEQEGFVPLLDAGAERGSPYLVMPFLSGGTLRARLARGPLPLDEAIALGRSLAQTLGRAHERGIVHRDLKPENILFAASGRALVADLGLAKHFDRNTPGASQSVSLSAEGQLRGTAGYMSPEQLRDAASVSAPADVFALGAILYECLAGEPAFRGETLLEVITHVELGAAAPLRRYRKDAPRWLEALVARALARDPARRPQDGLALDHALRDGPTLETRRRRRARIRLVAIVLIAGAAAVLAGLAATRSSSRGPQEPPPPKPVTPSEPEKKRLSKLVGSLGRYAWKHALPVSALAFSPDSKTLASGSDDTTVKLWDAVSGEELASFENERPVVALAWKADSKILVSTDAEGTLRVWDVAGRKLRRRILTSLNAANHIAFDREGLLVTSGTDEIIRMIDLDIGAVARKATRPPFVHGALTFSVGAERSAGFGPKGEACVWDTATGRPIRTIEAGPGFVNVALSRDGKDLIVSTGEGVTTYEVDSDKVTPLPTKVPMAPVLHVLATGMLVMGDMNGAVTFTSPSETGGPRPLQTGLLPVRGCASTSGGERVAWGRFSQIFVHDFGAKATSDSEPYVASFAVSRDEKQLATAGVDGTIRIFDVATGRPLPMLAHGGFVRLVAFTAEKELLSVGTDGSMKFWNTDTGARGRSAQGGKGTFQAGGISPDGTLLVLGDDKGAIVIRDLVAGSQREADLAQTKIVDAASMGDRVFACSEAGDVYSVDVATMRASRSASLTSASKAAFASDGSGALVADKLVVWIDMKGATRILGELPAQACALALSKDNKRALAASKDGTVVLWQIGPGPSVELERFTLPGGHDFAQAALFTRSGYLLGTARGVVLRYETVEPR